MSKSWSHPAPTECLKRIGGCFPAVRLGDLAQLPEIYQQAQTSSFKIGSRVYSIHPVSETGKPTVDWGYLAKVIDENELYFRLQFVAGT